MEYLRLQVRFILFKKFQVYRTTFQSITAALEYKDLIPFIHWKS
ncbi:hypothetical protein YQE_05041, partial [Dendroctonus ponderosae]